MKLFIAGYSGAGKTYTSDRLEQDHGFYHFDVEPLHKSKETFQAFAVDPIKTLSSFPVPLVVSWGITIGSINVANRILSDGFTFVWIDGKEDDLAESRKKRGDSNPRSKGVYDLWEAQRQIFEEFKSEWIIFEGFTSNGGRKKLCCEIADHFE